MGCKEKVKVVTRSLSLKILLEMIISRLSDYNYMILAKNGFIHIRNFT